MGQMRASSDHTMAEVRYQSLRARLNEFNYYQPLSPKSVDLAERMLVDLIESVQGFKKLKRVSDEQDAELGQREAELQALRFENPRLQTENNKLHGELIQAADAVAREEAEARVRLRALEDEVESTRLAMHRAASATAKWEHELHVLRQQAMMHLRLDPQDAPDDGNFPKSSLPEKSGESKSLWVSPEIAVQMESKAQCLERSLEQCVQQVAHLEETVAAAERRNAAMQAQAVAENQRLLEKGPNMAAIQRKAEAARLGEELVTLQADVGRQSAACGVLEEDCSELETECDARCREIEKLRGLTSRLARDLGVEEQRAGTAASENQEKIREAELELHACLERKRTAASDVKAVEVETLQARLAQVKRSAEFEKQASRRLTADLQAEHRAREELKSHTAAGMAAELERLKRAQSACAKARVDFEMLEGEVSSARLAVVEQGRVSNAQSEEIEAILSENARLQSRAQLAKAQVKLLTSTLHGLQSRHRAMSEHAEDSQRSLHGEEMECLDFRVREQRLRAIVESHERTGAEWSGELERSLLSLRSAHADLASAQQVENEAAREEVRLEADLQSVGESIVVASQQHDDLAAELQAWREDLQAGRQQGTIASASVRELQDALRRSEQEGHAAREALTSEERQGSELARTLNDEIRTAIATHTRMTELRDVGGHRLQLQMRASQEDLQTLQGGLHQLEWQHASLREECDSVGADCSQQEERAAERAERLEQLESHVQHACETRAASAVQLERAREREHERSQEVSLLEADLARCTERQAVVARTSFTLQQTVQQRALQCQRAKLEDESCAEELSAAKERVATMTVRCDRLHEDVEHLVGLVATADNFREQLTVEISERQRQLEMEEQARQALADMAPQWELEDQAAASDVCALQEAASKLDAERDAERCLADAHSVDLDCTERGIAEHESINAQLQGFIEDLRFAISNDTQELQEQQRVNSMQCCRAEELQETLARYHSEAKTSDAEAANVLADLQHMTKENQKLHQELHVLGQRFHALSTNTREQLAEQELSARRLGALEIERDDVLRLYHQVLHQTEQQSSVVARLKMEGDKCRTGIAELKAEIARRTECEDELRAREGQCRLDVSVLEEQFADLAGRIERAEQYRQQAAMDEERLEKNRAAAAAVCREVEKRGATRMHALASLGVQRQQLQAAVQRAILDTAASRQRAEEGRQQACLLEEVLEEERQRLWQREQENELLRRCLVERTAGGRPESRIPGVRPIADVPGSSNHGRESPAAMRQEVERRYREIAELDAQHESLKSEIVRLRARVRAGFHRTDWKALNS